MQRFVVAPLSLPCPHDTPLPVKILLPQAPFYATHNLSQINPHSSLYFPPKRKGTSWAHLIMSGVTAQELRAFDISFLKKDAEKLLWRAYLQGDLEPSKAPAAEKWMKTCVAYVNMGDVASLPDAPTFSQKVLQNANQSHYGKGYVSKGKGSGRGQSGKNNGDNNDYTHQRGLAAERVRERKEAERQRMERWRTEERQREAEAQRKWEEQMWCEEQEWTQWSQPQTQKQEWSQPEEKWTEEKPQYTPEEWAVWEEQQKRSRRGGGGGGGGGGGVSNASNTCSSTSPTQAHALCHLCSSDSPYCSKTGKPHTNSSKQANPERFMYGLIPTVEGHCVHLLDVVDEATGNPQGMKAKLQRSYYK